MNGKLCNKYKVTAASPQDPAQTTVSLFDFSAANNDPVKVLVDADGQQVAVNFKTFQRGAPDAALFELPKDYQKFSMPGLPPGISMPGQ